MVLRNSQQLIDRPFFPLYHCYKCSFTNWNSERRCILVQSISLSGTKNGISWYKGTRLSIAGWRQQYCCPEPAVLLPPASNSRLTWFVPPSAVFRTVNCREVYHNLCFPELLSMLVCSALPVFSTARYHVTSDMVG